jgi:hypothetical protein
MRETIKVEVEVLKPSYDIPKSARIVFRKVKQNETYFDGERWNTWLSSGESAQKYLVIQEKKYREPVLPADAGEICEVSYDNTEWFFTTLEGYKRGGNGEHFWLTSKTTNEAFPYCRIEVKK